MCRIFLFSLPLSLSHSHSSLCLLLFPVPHPESSKYCLSLAPSQTCYYHPTSFSGDPENCESVTLSENQICCQKQVFNVPDGNYRCCVLKNGNVTLYNTKQQNCSPDGEIKNLPSKIYLPTKKVKGKQRNAIVCQGIIFHNVSTSDFE